MKLKLLNFLSPERVLCFVPIIGDLFLCPLSMFLGMVKNQQLCSGKFSSNKMSRKCVSFPLVNCFSSDDNTIHTELQYSAITRKKCSPKSIEDSYKIFF